MKKKILTLILTFTAFSAVYSDAVASLYSGYHDYIDDEGSRRISSISAEAAADFIFGSVVGGIFVNGVFAVTEPKFILCKPGFEIGCLLWYTDLFYLITFRGAPVFHTESYVDKNMDICVGAEYRNYSRISAGKNLFFMFGFAMDYYLNKKNMAYTINIGLGSEAFFNTPKEPVFQAVE
ncbi:MAG: hypothetical protein LBD07_03655 [Spirochaetaceae bacterium]|jgi:hypothetical protein|nr:hypothetical protein [Spirochaetaceae bacterium]